MPSLSSMDKGTSVNYHMWVCESKWNILGLKFIWNPCYFQIDYFIIFLDLI